MFIYHHIFNLFLLPQLKVAILDELKVARLQAVPHTLSKVIQLFETKNSRHSTMIVGATQSGKTTSWRILQSTMSRMNRNGEQGYQVVKVRKRHASIHVNVRLLSDLSVYSPQMTVQ